MRVEVLLHAEENFAAHMRKFVIKQWRSLFRKSLMSLTCFLNGFGLLSQVVELFISSCRALHLKLSSSSSRVVEMRHNDGSRCGTTTNRDAARR
jgi:hypothetical protein